MPTKREVVGGLLSSIEKSLEEYRELFVIDCASPRVAALIASDARKLAEISAAYDSINPADTRSLREEDIRVGTPIITVGIGDKGHYAEDTITPKDNEVFSGDGTVFDLIKNGVEAGYDGWSDRVSFVDKPWMIEHVISRLFEIGTTGAKESARLVIMHRRR